ncbi:hypothetical protein QF028_005923 [Neobacillus sp. B4I6]|uniref:hypothetical protein n=1 Tax=Neobacillus sp. B4I6 TaxID=3373925 RepID=UPI003D24B6D4
MNHKSLIIVSPHNWYDHVKTNKINRPLKIVEQYYNKKLFKNVIIVNRIHPNRIINIKENERQLIKRGLLFNLFFDNKGEVYYLEHCLPFGKLESWALPPIFKQIIEKLNLNNIVLWVFDPKSVYLFNKIHATKIFDAYDDWSLSPLFQSKKRHIKYINKGYDLAKDIADIITTNTDYMKEKFDRTNGAVFVINNTSSLECQDIEIPQKVIQKNNGTQTVGYIGNIHERIDLNILENLLTSFPKTNFEFIGKNDYSSDEINILISKYKNIKLSGPVPYSMLPKYIVNFDACIVPHIVSKYTLSQDSMKIYDFLTFGKPIVSTSIPPTDKLSDLIYIANSPEEFISQLKLALNEKDTRLVKNRINYMKQNNWESKAKYIFSLLQEV